MSTLLYGFGPISQPEAEVRSTVTKVEGDEAPSVAAERPEPGGIVETDPYTSGGLTTNQMASRVIPSVQYVPEIGNANEDLTASVDRQISSSGTAAAREAAGQWGHGTMKIVEGIVPVFHDGGRFGPEYFAVGERERPSGEVLSSAGAVDGETSAAAQAGAVKRSREAVAATQSLYAAFLGGGS